MNLTIRHRLIILTSLPVLLIACAMFALNYYESGKLSKAQSDLSYDYAIAMKKEELKSYVEIATDALDVLAKAGGSKEQAIALVKNMQFGANYFFGYDSKGVRIFSNTDKGVGKNFWDFKDALGKHHVRELIGNAKKGIHTTYHFPKPNTDTPLPKLSFSAYVPQWDMVIATGFYIDDIDALVATMVDQTKAQLMQSSIDGLILVVVLIVFVYIFSYLQKLLFSLFIQVHIMISNDVFKASFFH